MDAQTIAQLIASSLNIAAGLLPELERIKGAKTDAELEALYEDLKGRADAIADKLRAP